MSQTRAWFILPLTALSQSLGVLMYFFVHSARFALQSINKEQKQPCSPNRNTNESGFTLVEAMVAAAIVGIGFVGIFSLSGVAMESMRKSLNKEKLQIQANQILDVISADASNMNNYASDLRTCTTPADGETNKIVLRRFEWCSRVRDAVGPAAGTDVRSITVSTLDSTRTLLTVRLEGYNGKVQIVAKRSFETP